VMPPHSPVPFASNLEDAYIPGVDDIGAGVRAVMAAT
jgi:pyruvate/2-oxoglutarate/acetoin dehydrogenase E1 component